MTIGPEPMSMIFRMSLRLGIMKEWVRIYEIIPVAGGFRKKPAAFFPKRDSSQAAWNRMVVCVSDILQQNQVDQHEDEEQRDGKT